MQKLCLGFCALALLFFASDGAQARGSTGGGGGRSGSSGWHGGGSHSRSHSSKHDTASYIVRHCKTGACYKKHPSGTYGFVPGHKRKQ